MYIIQTLNSISPKGLETFPDKFYQISNHNPAPDAIIVRSHDLHEFPFSSSVKVVGRAGAGVNNIPIDALTSLGIPVLNTPGANANAVKELVLAGMFMVSRNIFPAWDYVRELNCTDDGMLNEHVEKTKKQFSGFELKGKTLGIVGLGSIGVQVANAALGLGMRVIGYDPTITVYRAWELSSDVQPAASLDILLKEADFISLHIPLTPTTKHLISHTEFSQMKKKVVLLNFSREGIVDNEAVLSAIDQNLLFAYICDFPAIALKHASRVICLPHLGASTQQAEENCAVMISKQVRDYLEFGTISNAVNFPTIEASQTAFIIRLSIINANVPSMVAQISATLASRGINIVSLVNKSKDNIAYTLIDVNSDVNNDLITDIQKIPGVIRVRKIVGRNEN